MRKLFATALLALLSTGCAYKGACQINGQYNAEPYKDNSRYSSVTCTEYCSVQIPGLCRNSPSEMMQAVEDKHFEQDKNLCAKYGIADKTEAMTNCLMKERADRVAAQAARAAQDARARQEENMRRAAAIQAVSEQPQHHSDNPFMINNTPPATSQARTGFQPQPVVPTKIVDFPCLNNCTAAGNGYSLCQSKCSY